MQKANSLLGELGGTSSVYGVDAGATPAPPTVPNASPYPGGGIAARRLASGIPPATRREGCKTSSPISPRNLVADPGSPERPLAAA